MSNLSPQASGTLSSFNAAPAPDAERTALACCASRAFATAFTASRPYPDAAAHNLQAQDEPTYDVRFRTEDLWPQSADAAAVHVGVFESYLEKAP